MRAIVVGGGIMGLSTAWALARAGHEVELFEQGAIPNPVASSADEHRLIRYPYGASTAYAAMVAEAYEAWDLLWADLGERLYVPTGVLALASDGSAWARQSAESLEAIGRPGALLNGAALADRFPALHLDDVDLGLWHEDGGVLLAEAIVAALGAHLGGRVRLRTHTPVRAVDPDRAEVVLDDGAVHGADVIIVAAGAWITRLVPGLGGRVTPSRQVVAYLEPPVGTAEAWARSPMLIDLGTDSGFYLVPAVAGRGLKVGDHRFSLTGEPDRDREAGGHEADPLLEACARRIRGFEAWRLKHLRTCYYTVEPEERFVIEPVGRAGWAMSPCSGHGFKFGARLGLAMADAVAGRFPGISDWAAGRMSALAAE